MLAFSSKELIFASFESFINGDIENCVIFICPNLVLVSVVAVGETCLPEVFIMWRNIKNFSVVAMQWAGMQFVGKPVDETVSSFKDKLLYERYIVECYFRHKCVVQAVGLKMLGQIEERAKFQQGKFENVAILRQKPIAH